MPWRRFTALIGGLSGESVWRWWRKNKGLAPLEGDAATAYASSIGR